MHSIESHSGAVQELSVSRRDKRSVSGTSRPINESSIGAGASRPCNRCTAPSQVKILLAYDGVVPRYQCFCLKCVHEIDSPRAAGASRRWRRAAFIAVSGVAVGFLSAIIDLTVLRTNAGLGWSYHGGVALGGLLVLVGAIMRMESAAFLGTAAFAGFGCWDWIGRHTWAPGFGWAPHVTMSLAVALVVLGTLSWRFGLFARSASLTHASLDVRHGAAGAPHVLRNAK